MKIKWTVKHFWSNPANNTTHEFNNRHDAEIEARKMTSDDPGSSSIITSNNDHYGCRDWTKAKISWK